MAPLGQAMEHIKQEKDKEMEDTVQKAMKIDEEMQTYYQELMKGQIIDEDAIANTPEVLPTTATHASLTQLKAGETEYQADKLPRTL